MRGERGIVCWGTVAGWFLVIFGIVSLIKVVIIMMIMQGRLVGNGGFEQTGIGGRGAGYVMGASRKSLINSVIVRLLLFIQSRIRRFEVHGHAPSGDSGGSSSIVASMFVFLIW